MVILITGASHTGKTLLAQRLLAQYHYPYLSIDWLKMGLIRSGNTQLTPTDDTELEEYLWKIVREMVKTAIENRQNLIVEGCYIPLNWREDFSEPYLHDIRFCCLVMSERYIINHFDAIRQHANDIEQRINDDCTLDGLLQDNARYAALCQKYGCNFVYIDDHYPQDFKDFGGILP